MTRSWVGFGLAIVQLGIFVTMAVSFHRSSLKLSPSGNREYFGCITLQKHNPDPDCGEYSIQYGPCHGELYWSASECRDFLSTKIVMLINLPVFILAGLASRLGWRIGISQVWSFYLVTMLGIPVFWYLIGAWAQRRVKKAESPIPD
jgi:hypothetical protein